MQGHRQKAKTKRKQYSTTSNIVIIYCFFIGCKKERVSRLHGIETGSPMIVTLIPQYNVGEKTTVFFPFILDIKFVGRTSRGHTGGRSHRISHPPSFCGGCLNFSRGKDSVFPFPRQPRSRILCTNDLIVLHLLGIFLFFYILVGKNPSYRDSNSRPNVSGGCGVTN